MFLKPKKYVLTFFKKYFFSLLFFYFYLFHFIKNLLFLYLKQKKINIEIMKNPENSENIFLIIT